MNLEILKAFTWINFSEDENFFPNCFPYLDEKIPKEISEKYEIKKYYKPLRGFQLQNIL